MAEGECTGKAEYYRVKRRGLMFAVLFAVVTVGVFFYSLS